VVGQKPRYEFVPAGRNAIDGSASAAPSKDGVIGSDNISLSQPIFMAASPDKRRAATVRSGDKCLGNGALAVLHHASCAKWGLVPCART
jgi:hypothetical protein